MAEESIEEGNKELQIYLQKKPLSTDAIQRPQSKIKMGLKKKKTGSRNLFVNQPKKKNYQYKISVQF